jgi:hypothetical protein
VQSVRDLKLGVRLGLGYAAVILALVVVTGFAAMVASGLNSGTNYVVAGVYPKIADFFHAQEDLSQVAIMTRDVAMFTDQDATKKGLAQIETKFAKANALLDTVYDAIKTEKRSEAQTRDLIEYSHGKLSAEIVLDMFKPIFAARDQYAAAQTEYPRRYVRRTAYAIY